MEPDETPENEAQAFAPIAEAEAQTSASVPETSFGLPAWTKWTSRTAILPDGLSRRVFAQAPLTVEEAKTCEQAVRFFLKARKVQFQETERYVDEERKGGPVRRFRSVFRPARMDDIASLAYCLSKRTGMPLKPEEIHIRITMGDGRRYRITPDGESLGVCLFCKATNIPLEYRKDGVYHTDCMTRALMRHRRQQVAERDVVLAKAKAGA